MTVREILPSHPDPPAGSATAKFLDGHEHYLVPTYTKPPPVFVSGSGSRLTDMEGRSYLDFTTGFSVNNLGLCDPHVAAIIADQAKVLLQSNSEFHNPWAGPLAKLLCEKTVESGGMKAAAAAFVNSGTEAVEVAIKHVKRVGRDRDPSGKKVEVAYFGAAFHGVTLGSLSATPGPRQDDFAPLVGGFVMGRLNDVDAVDELVTDRTCGVLLEVVQGVGGVHVATEEFCVRLARRCREVGAVLVHDDIQCGLGRTGTLWAHGTLPPEAHPDILVLAKAIGNGYPMGAVLVTEEVRSHLRVGDTGSTLGANPMACRIAHHIVQRLADPDLLAGVRRKAGIFFARLRRLRARYPRVIRDVRGRGLMIGIELAAVPTELVDAARIRGLLLVWSAGSVVRPLPPLTITDAELEEGLDILESAFAATFGVGDSVS